MSRNLACLLIGLAFVLAGCGLVPSAFTHVEELEGGIARCLRIPADQVTLASDEKGAVAELAIEIPPARDDVSPDVGAQLCLTAIGLAGV